MVLAPQEPNSGAMLLRSGFDQVGSASHHNEGQEIPILRVPVGDESNARVLENIPDALEAGRGYFFGFLVEGYVNPAPVEGVASRATRCRTRKEVSSGERTAGSSLIPLSAGRITVMIHSVKCIGS